MISTATRRPYTSSSGEAATLSVSYKKQHYFGVLQTNKALNVTTGAIVSNTDVDITNVIPITGGTPLVISTDDSTTMNVFGFTYDNNGVGIAPIRDVALFNTAIATYSFTPPANAASMILYVRYVNKAWSGQMRVEAASAVSEVIPRPYSIHKVPEGYGGTAIQKINQALTDAANSYSKKVVLNLDYEIDSAIIVPSGVTLEVNGRVKMSTGMKDNFLRNKAIANPNAIIATPDKDILITGSGRFEGSGSTWGGGYPTGVNNKYWRAIGVLMGNVDGFEVSGLTVKESHMWGLCFEQCRYGDIENIDFQQTGVHLNQDGIDIRRGSHDINITNIKGSTHDDFIALTNIVAEPEFNILGTTIYDPARTNLDIYNINISNLVRRTSNIFPANIFPAGSPTHYGGGLLLLCEDGLKIYNVNISNVSGVQQIHLGYSALKYWSTTQATVNDMYNIHIKNTGDAPIYLNRPIKDSSFINVLNATSNGNTTVTPKAGSLRLTRKYHNGDREFITTVA